MSVYCMQSKYFKNQPMKTLKEINKEIAEENKGKTAVDSLISKAATYASYYELARIRCEVLEKEIETLKNR